MGTKVSAMAIRSLKATDGERLDVKRVQSDGVTPFGCFECFQPSRGLPPPSYKATALPACSNDNKESPVSIARGTQLCRKR